MDISLKKIVFSNACMMICSVIIGYSLWFMLSQNQIIQDTIAVPTTIFNANNTVLHHTTTSVTVEGARFILKSIQYHPPRISIYTDEHRESPFVITTSDILLPETLSIVDYWPKTITLSN